MARKERVATHFANALESPVRISQRFRMPLRAPAFLVFLLSCPALFAGSQNKTESVAAPANRAPEDLGPTLTALCENSSVPGVAALILRGDTVVARGVTGVRKAGEPALIQIDDRFHLGSDTKAMTATLLALLVEEGRLSWNTTIGDIFAEKVPALKDERKQVTLDQLLRHRAGAPANLGAGLRLRLRLNAGTPTGQRVELARDVLTTPPESAPGTRYTYSNAGYALAGAMAEIVTGQSWEDLMQTRVFSPLGITTAGFGPPGTPGKIDQPLGHTAGGLPMPPGPLADNPPAIGPAGTIHMSISDWSRFIALHLRGDAANPHRETHLLKAESFSHLHAPDAGDDHHYMAGWMVLERPWAKGAKAGDRGKVLTHSGSNTLWFCTTWIAPERDFAILVTCNQGGQPASILCDHIVGELLKKLDQLP